MITVSYNRILRVEATWARLIGWPHKTSSTYIPNTHLVLTIHCVVSRLGVSLKLPTVPLISLWTQKVMGRPPTKIVSKYSKTLTIRRSGKIVLRYSQDWAQIPTIYYKKNWNKAKKVEKSRNLSQNEAGVVVWIRSRVDLENNEFENCMHNDSLCLQSGKCSQKCLGSSK